MTLEDIPENLVVRITDVRRHHCVAGARRWFEANGLDFRDFLVNGISARTLAAVDALGFAVAEDVVNRNG